MPITLKGSVMKVGNSMALILPKPVIDNYDVEKGDSLEIVITDKGIYIPLTPTMNLKKSTEQWIKRIEK